MADHVSITAGAGTVVATDEVGGAHYQLVKIVWGVDGTATLVSASNPIPVVQTGTPALATGAATDAKLDTIISAHSTLLTELQQKLEAGGEVTLSAASLAALETIELGATTLAALETTELGATTLAALETIDLGATTLAALETVSTSVQTVTEAAPAQITAATSSTTLAASNASRKGLTIFNDSTSVLYVKFGSAASATSYKVKMAAGAYYEMPTDQVYTGIVTGIWVAADGYAMVGEGT